MRDVTDLDKILLTGFTPDRDRPLRSVDAFVDFAGRHRELGFTEIVIHWPIPDSDFAADHKVFEQIAMEALAQLGRPARSVICVSSVHSPARPCWHMRENDPVTSATRQPGTPAAATPARLIATDLDGTLLRDDKSVSPRTVAALAAAEEAGIEVFFVTGRPARWMDVVSEHVHGHGLAICGNGAAVVDLHGGPGAHRFVKVRELTRENALDAVRLLRDAAPGTVFAVEQTYGFHQEPAYPKLHMETPDHLLPAEKLLAPEGPDADQPVLKILAYHPELDPDAFLTLARLAIGDHANVTRSSPSALLELSGPDVSKASTLALCCAERGISHEEVVAFGDMPNDVEMLTWAGRSYAMGNAHPDVVAAASGRTVANNDDGVAVVIEQLLAERRP